MKTTFSILLLILSSSVQLFGQEKLLHPANHKANTDLLKSETYKMSWFVLKDTLKIQIGSIQTEIQKGKEKIHIITSVSMKQSPAKWIDTTIVNTETFAPLYHSSFNQQRDMVLKFKEKVTGYYLDKKTNIKTAISEKVDTPFFDSNFYPQLIRFLPLTNKYSNTISIFDYNPSAKIGVMTATIKSTEETSIKINGKEIRVWKVTASDDISNNAAVSTYYIDKKTRKLLKQEINIGGRKMLMELTK